MGPIKRLSSVSSTSTQSEFSFCSTLDDVSDVISTSDDASERCFSCAESLDDSRHQSDCMLFNFPAPTSSLDSPRSSIERLLDADSVRAPIHVIQTKLKAESPAFRPVSADTGLDAVANAIYLALLSTKQTFNVKMEKGMKGTAPTVISAEVHGGPQASTRCYEAVHLAKQALEQITTRLDTVALLSKRVQKEDRGYSLRSSVAFVPSCAEDRMCWDLFHNGNCPRRNKCHWYPQEADIGRVRVNIRCTEGASGVSSEKQLVAGSPVVRHKISLGELV